MQQALWTIQKTLHRVPWVNLCHPANTIRCHINQQRLQPHVNFLRDYQCTFCFRGQHHLHMSCESSEPPQSIQHLVHHSNQRQYPTILDLLLLKVT